jgi:hypothetical protein
MSILRSSPDLADGLAEILVGGKKDAGAGFDGGILG